ncbi:MAG: DNA polymerase/3'-5' exonuclease PolX [Nitrospiraceae bacterium]
MSSPTKREIVEILEDIGLLLELKGESPFKSQAYYNAARTIAGVTDDLAGMVATGRIRELKGIGQALADKLAELMETGRLVYYEELKRSVPAGLVDMRAIAGMGPKKILTVWQQLGVTTVGELDYACIENRLVGLPGFGQKTQDKIRQGILQFKKRQGFQLFPNAIEEAQALLAACLSVSGVVRVELVGDLRRCMEIVQTIELVVVTDRPDSIGPALVAQGIDHRLIQEGPVLRGRSALGLAVVIHVTPFLSPHFLLSRSGNDQHLARLRDRAMARGVIWNLDEDRGPLSPPAEHEADLYRALDLPWIEPELREGLGEIEEAERGELARLVTAHDIQGIFHNHTTASDGSSTLEEMVEEARRLGYRYIGISDHSQSAFYANGLKEDRIREQHAAIDALRKRLPDILILKGIEADILVDGAMDYPDEVLAAFDFVIASVHSRFNLPEEEQTARVVRALANPHVTMLGHPTGRLLLSREGYRIDMARVIQAAKEHGKILEINANPHRLDLDWRLCAAVREQGVKVSINPDAHVADGLRDVPFGVNVARKGGLSVTDVVNTLEPAEIQAALKQ